MRHLHLAELRNSWSAWLGVSVAFLVSNLTLALCALVWLAGERMIAAGDLDRLQSGALTLTPELNLVFCAMVAISVLGSSTSLVVDSRRGSLARLALSGATPGQVVATVMTQLAVFSVACSLLADALAYALLVPTLRYVAGEQEEFVGVPEPVYAVWPVLLANLLAVGVALLGGYRQARRASRIPPVEALRQSTGVSAERMTVLRWLGGGLLLALIIAAYALVPTLTAVHTSETMSNLLITSIGLLVLTAALLARLAPLLVGPLTRAWTRLVPTADASWLLARSTTVAKGPRLIKSVIPVMMAIGLLFGMLAIWDTLIASLAANGYHEDMSNTGPAALLGLIGLPLAVALAGGVGSLVMMGKQRDAELALCGIVGATPAQRFAMPVLEGTIIAVTGAILALVMVATSIGFLAVSFPAAGFVFAFAPSWPTFAGALAVSWAITVAATVVPTLPALRRPEPKVIARLVAE